MTPAATTAAAFAVLACTAPSVRALIPGAWSDTTMDPDARAQALLDKMTLEEKIVMLHGPPKSSGPAAQCNFSARCAYVGNVAPNTRLDIPPITMNDGPQGFRDNNNPASTTAWPSGLTMAASWDVDAMLEWGDGMGKEFYAKGANVQLGPGLCLARVPRNGRNFEYLSGEDPILGKTLVQPVIKGIQQNKVVANAKHWVLNNEESNRHGVSENADERTRYEMYYPPFVGAVEAGVGSFMCSYNLINGKWSCENPVTLADDLKTSIGFKGYVMSDWGATHSTSIMAGLDMEMPSNRYMNSDAINAGLAAKNITMDGVNDAVFRILRAMFAVGVMDEPTSAWDWNKLKNNVTSEASVRSCRSLSAASTVLLKNDNGILPLAKGSGKKLALLGFAGDGAVVHGGGSGSVIASYTATPLVGITAQAGAGADIVFNDGTDIAAAAAAAKAADVAIVFAGTLSHEGGDRASLSLDDGCVGDNRPGHTDSQCQGNANQQNALIAAVAKANPNTVVVLSVPGAVLMPWAHDVAAILTNFMPGQQAGNAIADVLFGDVNPSAKLPITFPNKENETEFSPAQWPGLPNPAMPEYANYSERLLVGYRYYDYHNIQFDTGYPFGHGLSYTTFKFAGITAEASAAPESAATSSYNVSFTLSNTGKVAGAEVAQLYVAFPAAAGEPPKVLRRFAKASLDAGASAAVTFSPPLGNSDFSIWDTAAHGWKCVPGEYELMVGGSSRDIFLSQKIDVSC